MHKNEGTYLCNASIDRMRVLIYNDIKIRNQKRSEENTMKYFVNISTLEELRKEYRRLAKVNHPDMGIWQYLHLQRRIKE